VKMIRKRPTTARRPSPDRSRPSQSFVETFAKRPIRFGTYCSQCALIALTPLAIICLICWSRHVLWQGGYDPLDALASGAPLASRAMSEHVTMRVPFLSDLPGLGLSLASCLSIAQYLILLRLRFSLRDDLLASGLITESTANQDELFDPPMKVKLSGPSTRVPLFTIFLATGAWVYAKIRTTGRIFYKISKLTGWRVSSATLREHWWAAHDPVLAICWVLLGAVGAYCACLQITTSMSMLRSLEYLGNKRKLILIPTRLSPDNGWRPATRLIDSKAAGVVILLVTWSSFWMYLHGISLVIQCLLIAVFVVAIAVSVSHSKIVVSVVTIHRKMVDAKIQATESLLNRAIQHHSGRKVTHRNYATATYCCMVLEDLALVRKQGIYRSVLVSKTIRFVVPALSILAAFFTLSRF